MSGAPLQTPFAEPPGVGLSSSTVNVAWGLFNLLMAYLLLLRVGSFDLRRGSHFLCSAAGFAAMSFMRARAPGKLHGGAL